MHENSRESSGTLMNGAINNYGVQFEISKYVLHSSLHENPNTRLKQSLTI